MKEFILQNWKLILSGILVLISFIISILRKKPVQVIESVKGALADFIDDAINAAEAHYGKGHGELKFVYVMNLIRDWFKLNNFTFTDFYADYSRKKIESVLSTPTKHDGDER